MRSDPAFPQSDPIDDGSHPSYGKDRGMTLRDYFASKAMPVALKIMMHGYKRDDDNWSWEHEDDNALLAELSYEIADAMLKVREA